MAGFGEAFQKSYSEGKEQKWRSEEAEMDRNWQETMKLKTERRATAQKEKEALRAGKAYADMYAKGDPDAAAAIAEMGLAVGWDKTLKSLENGEFVRLKGATEAAPENQNILDAVEHGSGNIAEESENFMGDPKRKVEVVRDTPEVRKDIELTGDAANPYKSDAEGGKWGFRAKAVDPDANFTMRKLSELVELEKRAIARNDPRMAAMYASQIDSHARAERLKSKSETEGMDMAGNKWFYVVNNGVAVGTPGRIEEDANGNQIVTDLQGNEIIADSIRPATKELDEKVQKFFDDIGGSEQYKEYGKQQLAYAETLGTTGRMSFLVNQYPELANTSGSLAKSASNLSENVKGVVQIINTQFSGEPDGPLDAEKLSQLDDVEDRIDGLLEQGVTEIADAKALFDSLKEITTYKVLATLEEGKFSDTDVERIQKALQPADRPETILKNLNQINSILGNKVKGQYVQLSKNNTAAQAFEFSNGFLPPISIVDTEQYLSELDDPYALEAYQKSRDPNSMYTPRGGQQQSMRPSINSGAVDYLKANPDLRDAFDAKYGTEDNPNPSRDILEGN